MKSWLTIFRISSAVDDRKPLPPALKRAIARSNEARGFAENSDALARALKDQLAKPQASEALHTSIMRAVRTAVRPRGMAGQNFRPRWIPVGSIALLMLLGFFVASRFYPASNNAVKTTKSPSLAAASSALEVGGGIIREVPGVALSPLSDEIQRLDRDLTNTEQFLLASLPL